MTSATTAFTPESLVQDYERFKLSKCSSARASATRISDLGHPCTAYLAFTRVAGEQRDLPDKVLAMIFDEGRLQERAVMQDLQAMGYDVIESQRTIHWGKYEITGHPDCKISRNGSKPIPTEIKSCSPFVFAKLNSEDDVRNHSSWIYRKWAAQIQLYLLLESEEVGWLVLKSKTTGQIKIIVFTLDLAYAEQFIKKAETVKVGVAYHDSEGPWKVWLKEHRLNDPDICLECPFKAICLPEIDAGPGAYFDTDPEILAKLDRRAELEPASAEFEELDDDIKSHAKKIYASGQTEIVAGNWHIRGAAQQRTMYNVPNDVKSKYARQQTVWVTKIARIEG